jgi:hypothetical protein
MPLSYGLRLLGDPNGGVYGNDARYYGVDDFVWYSYPCAAGVNGIRVFGKERRADPALTVDHPTYYIRKAITESKSSVFLRT